MTGNVVIALVTVLLIASACVNASTKDHPPIEPPLPSSVATWSIADVERWMKYTVGYAEYVPTITLHAIDGPTLLYLTAREVEDHFNVINSIHLAKIRAHLQILRGSCVCPRQSAGRKDFWEALKEDNARTWIFGLTALFMPRTAFLGAYLFDTDLFTFLYAEPRTALDTELASSIVGHAVEAADDSGAATAAPWHFILMALGCPNLLLLVKTAYFFDVNYVLVAVTLVHLLICQYNELGLIYLIMNRKLLEDEEKKDTKKALVALLKIFVGFSPVFPVVAYVTSFFIPYLLQQLAVGLFVIYVALTSVGVVAMAIKHFASGGESTGDQQQQQDPKQE